MLRSPLLAILVLMLSSCKTMSGEHNELSTIIGAWASGEGIDVCKTAPITYFSSDSVVIVLLTANGPIHSFGKWDHIGQTVVMTHNDFPLDSGGISNAPVELEIVELSKSRFVTRNAKGDIRVRKRCESIKLKNSHDELGH